MDEWTLQKPINSLLMCLCGSCTAAVAAAATVEAAADLLLTWSQLIAPLTCSSWKEEREEGSSPPLPHPPPPLPTSPSPPLPPAGLPPPLFLFPPSPFLPPTLPPPFLFLFLLLLLHLQPFFSPSPLTAVLHSVLIISLTAKWRKKRPRWEHNKKNKKRLKRNFLWPCGTIKICPQLIRSLAAFGMKPPS